MPVDRRTPSDRIKGVGRSLFSPGHRKNTCNGGPVSAIVGVPRVRDFLTCTHVHSPATLGSLFTLPDKQAKNPRGRYEEKPQSWSTDRALVDEYPLTRRVPESPASYAVALGTIDSACSKSAMRSSVASRPTESRINVSEIPLLARSSGERLEWTA